MMAEHAHLGVAAEVLVHGHHQRRVAGVQHVVEHDHALGREHGGGELQVPGQRRARVLAVDMDEARAPTAELGQQLGRRHAAAVGLPGDAPIRGHAVLGAVGLEAVDDLGVGPVEQVDAERRLAGGQRMRQGDEEAPLERADLGDRAGHAHLGLHAQQSAADGRCKPRRHAGHGGVAGRRDSGRRRRCRSGWLRWSGVRRQRRTFVNSLEDCGATIAEAWGFRKAER